MIKAADSPLLQLVLKSGVDFIPSGTFYPQSLIEVFI